MPRWKAWTMGEIKRLKELRSEGLEVQECADKLGRSKPSVSQQLYRLRLVSTYRKSNKELDEKIIELVGRGWVDELIAYHLGLPKLTITNYRRRLKLKGNRITRQKNRMKCWDCGRLVPTVVPTQMRFTGWKRRIIRPAGAPMYECYCPKCFEKHGFLKDATLDMHSAPDAVGIDKGKTVYRIECVRT